MEEHADRLFDAKELQRAVKTLADFVADDRAKPTAAVKDALEVYASACRLVNDRLGDCHRLVKLGQRSEALRQVQMEPDALLMYDQLQFKHVKHLPDVCHECKLTPPPRLDVTAAGKLNEAFAIEDKHQDILRLHRVLALSRAPLRRRLEVIRLIRKAAPTEFFWQDDIAEYEAKRVEEIRGILSDPRSRGDWATINGLFQEVTTADGWVAPFPLDLSEMIKKARKELLIQSFSEELKPLQTRLAGPLQKLAAAVDTLTEPRSFRDGQDAAEDFDQLEAIVVRAVSDADTIRSKYEGKAEGRLMNSFVEAAEWLTDGRKRRKWWREFEKAVADLDNALSNGVEWYYVQEYYRVASEFQLPLPKSVVERFRARASSSRMFWIIGLVAAVVVIAVILVLVFVKF